MTEKTTVNASITTQKVIKTGSFIIDVLSEFSLSKIEVVDNDEKTVLIVDQKDIHMNNWLGLDNGIDKIHYRVKINLDKELFMSSKYKIGLFSEGDAVLSYINYTRYDTKSVVKQKEVSSIESIPNLTNCYRLLSKKNEIFLIEPKMKSENKEVKGFEIINKFLIFSENYLESCSKLNIKTRFLNLAENKKKEVEKSLKTIEIINNESLFIRKKVNSKCLGNIIIRLEKQIETLKKDKLKDEDKLKESLLQIIKIQSGVLKKENSSKIEMSYKINNKQNGSDESLKRFSLNDLPQEYSEEYFLSQLNKEESCKSSRKPLRNQVKDKKVIIKKTKLKGKKDLIKDTSPIELNSSLLIKDEETLDTAIKSEPEDVETEILSFENINPLIPSLDDDNGQVKSIIEEHNSGEEHFIDSESPTHGKGEHLSDLNGNFIKKQDNLINLIEKKESNKYGSTLFWMGCGVVGVIGLLIAKKMLF